MFKLKILNKPILLKLKCNFEFPPIILANLQEKAIIPTKEIQEVVADVSYDGLSKVVVNEIPTQYIIPSGDIQISQNGVYDVRELENANVNVKSNLGTKEIVVNGEYKANDDNLDGYSSVNVNIPSKKLGIKEITENGVYKANDDDLDGYSEVEVATSGVDINDYFETTFSSGFSTQWIQKNYIKKLPDLIIGENINFIANLCDGAYYVPKIINLNLLVTEFNQLYYNFKGTSLDTSGLNTSKITSMYSMFQSCAYLQSLDLSNFDTSNVTTMGYMFDSATRLTELDISNFNFENVTFMTCMFSNCSALKMLSVNQFNTKNVTTFYRTFNYCKEIQTLPIIEGDSAISLTGMFTRCNNLTNFGGLKNIGKAYLTTSSANNSNYSLELIYCSNLTHESLMNVINNLYDIKTKGCNTQELILGSTNLAKLTAEEIATATNLGWTLS